MKNLQFKKSAVPLNEKFIKERRGYGYLYILFIAVLIISVLTLISTAYSDQNGFKVLLDSVNNSNVIYFDYGKSELRPAALELLDKISEEMKSNPGYILYITGYTDDLGSENFNDGLSLMRANSVKEYLQSTGISGENLIVSGKGESEPVSENTSENSRAKNRRVEFSYSNPVENRGNYAIDKFPHRRYYAEPTLKNDRVNTIFTVKSREEITADLSIRDSAGKPIDSIKTEDLSATLRWDNNGNIDSTEGQPRLIPINDKKKIAFTLTMDYSGSMYGDDTQNPFVKKSDKVAAMEKSVALFINLLGGNMFCKIIKFGGKVLQPIRFTRSKSVLLSALENNSFPMGGTALYSSIYTALKDTTYYSNPTVMKTVVAFTDGMENSSGKITLDSIYRKSAAYNTKVFTVGLFDDVGDYVPDESELKRRKADMISIAQNTGGFFYQADNAADLKQIYANILDQVLKSYHISIVWNSAKLPAKGTMVKAELKINVKGTVRVLYKNYTIE